MDPKDFINMKKEITKLSEDLDIVIKTINGIKLTQQGFLKGNDLIPPGIATKIAFDSKGLILKKMNLDVNDLPDIPIDKIIGLRRIIRKMEEAEIQTLEKSMEINQGRKSTSTQTGVKLNRDNDGNIIGSSNLIIDDIPELPIGKIIGLMERLSMLEQKESIEVNRNEFMVNPGNGTNITWDNKGRVIRSNRLTMHDLPKELIDELSEIQTRIASTASQENFNNWIIEIRGKINELSSDNINKKITIRDLPKLSIQDISNLENLLRSKIERSEISELQNNISTLLDYDPKLDIQQLKIQLRNKVEKEELSNIKNEIMTINRRLGQYETHLPPEGFQMDLKQIIDSITTIQGQIKSIEQKIMMKEFNIKSEGD